MKKSIIRNLIVICCAFILFSLIIPMIVAGLAPLVYLLLIIIPFISFAVYTISYIRKRIIQPINHMIDEANAISSGDLSHTIEYKINDELGAFISAFDSMRNTLYIQKQRQDQFEIDRKNFIDSISHDLKTPLASISAYIEALQDGVVATPEEGRQYLKIIENKVAVLIELSNQLSLSYQSPGTLPLSLQKVNCYCWTASLLHDIEAECQMKNIQVELANNISADNKSSISIDIRQLDRAIQNILNNVFRYYQKYFSIKAEISREQLVLIIKNDGAELQTDEINRIFDRFYTQEPLNDQGHLGLGLYISKTIIHAMGGDISASVKSGIITFKIVLKVL